VFVFVGNLPGEKVGKKNCQETKTRRTIKASSKESYRGKVTEEKKVKVVTRKKGI
jgi:hypothetical protein